MQKRVRLVTLDDAVILAELRQSNRDFLSPWEPTRPEHYFTVDGQAEDVRDALSRHSKGETLPFVIVSDDGVVVGRVNLTGIIRGALQSCSLGYWVAERHNGRGYATSAVLATVQAAFTDFGLHRVAAGTLESNTGSQRVLEKAGFSRYGLAPRYLRIADQWQDHVMFQRLNE